MEITEIQNVGAGLVLVSGCSFGTHYREQLWARVKIRAHKNCVNCSMPLKGKDGYRPVTNLENRSLRLCVTCAEQEQWVDGVHIGHWEDSSKTTEKR